jgi:hypothetical protein
MATSKDQDMHDSEFVGVSLRDSRFVESDLSGIVMRGVDISRADIDAPWLLETGRGWLLVNGVDVAPYVESELNARFPGRAERRASDPDGLRTAWAHLERTWAATLKRVAAMPEGTVDASVAGEWSFAQTLRHLVFATDLWIGKTVLELDDPFHPLGLGDTSAEEEGLDADLDSAETAPPYADVLAARASRVALMRDFLATVTADDLTVMRDNPHNAKYRESTLSCARTILEEEWEHHRFAVRDLDGIARDRGLDHHATSTAG